VFKFRSPSESPVGGFAHDVITDFAGQQTVVDRLDVSAIDANSRVAGNQGFTFVGDNGNFTGAGQVRTVGDGFTIVQFETNGDGVVDFEVQLNGNLNLTADNFISDAGGGGTCPAAPPLPQRAASRGSAVPADRLEMVATAHRGVRPVRRRP
jgi:hypothetical protein